MRLEVDGLRQNLRGHIAEMGIEQEQHIDDSCAWHCVACLFPGLVLGQAYRETHLRAPVHSNEPIQPQKALFTILKDCGCAGNRGTQAGGRS